MALDEKKLALYLVNELTGNLTVEEQRLLHQQLADNGDDEFSDPAQVWRELRKTYEVDKEAAWAKLSARLDIQPVETIRTRRLKRTGIALFFLIVSFSIWLFTGNTDTKSLVIVPASPDSTNYTNITLLVHGLQPVSLEHQKNKVADAFPYGKVEVDSFIHFVSLAASPLLNTLPYSRTYTLYTGENNTRIILPDNSTIWLQRNSSLTLQLPFSGDERHVQVMGAADFNIEKDDKHPFRVSVMTPMQRKRMEIEVLGTRFTVRAYPNSRSMKTILVEGSLAININGQRNLLKAGEQVQLTETGSPELSAAEYFVFTDEDITDIIDQLNDWYNTNITITTKERKRFTMKFPRKTDINKVLDILNKEYHIQTTSDGNHIVVTGI